MLQELKRVRERPFRGKQNGNETYDFSILTSLMMMLETVELAPSFPSEPIERPWVPRQ